MTAFYADQVLECEGLACPLPVVRTKKAVDELNAGAVLEVRATDKGSVADLQGWAKRTGHHYVGMKEENGVFRHFIRKTDASEMKEAITYPGTISHEEISRKLEEGGRIHFLDVREPAEFAFGRMPGAQSIPWGDLEARLHELDPNEEYIVVCRSGVRSDLACQMMADKGFMHVRNAVQGMTAWTGRIDKDES